jgi:hypothetical protein
VILAAQHNKSGLMCALGVSNQEAVLPSFSWRAGVLPCLWDAK